MEVTNEMVDALIEAIYATTDHWPHEKTTSPSDSMRQQARTGLRAALSSAPDRYRAGWIAGRDAAAECIEVQTGFQYSRIYSTIARRIRALEPPEPPK